MLENKLASDKKELQQAKNDNAALARYINARRKKEEAQRKAMVVAPMFDECPDLEEVVLQGWSKASPSSC
jgi:hypothetical protein